MSTSATPSPIVKAFLVCDQVIHDAQTGKKSLIGVFHELRAERFPAVHPMLWIYANITEARGKYRIEIQLVDVDRNTVLGRGQPPEIVISKPPETTEISAQLRNVALPGPGTYEFHLLVNDELLATKAVRVSGIPGANPSEGGATPA